MSREFSKKMTVVLMLLPLLLQSASPAREAARSVDHSQGSSQLQDVQKQTPRLISQMRIHGFLLWASMGFLMPIGVLVIRMSSRVHTGKTQKMLLYAHVILEVASVLLATAGAMLAVKNFENAFNNPHQRMGLVLFALIWLQPLTGFLRPQRGARGRRVWYSVHWFLGTGLCALAIIDVYFGLHAYNVKTQRSARVWIVLFTAEVAVIAFIYLLQDRWEYMQKQGVILGHEQVTPADRVALATPPTSALKLEGVH